jgi:uncharacterized protein YggU (UPF0235/DUF167 family)
MYIKVRVISNAKKEILQEIKTNHFECFLKEKAQKGKANKRLLEILTHKFNQKNIKIINGAHHPIKLIKIGD